MLNRKQLCKIEIRRIKYICCFGGILNRIKMREYIPANFKKHDKSLREIEYLKKVVENKMFSIGLDYVNKITGQLKNDKFYEIRNSIELRIDSIIFHYKIMNQIHNPENPLLANRIFPFYY